MRMSQSLEALKQANHQWVLDFMHNFLYLGKRSRALNAVDEGTRECFAIEVDFALPVGRVVCVLKQLKGDAD